MLRRRIPVSSLAGRLCVITGAASGIGRATAVAAAQHGARLVVTDVNEAGLDTLAAELGDAVVARRAFDISDYDAVRTFADDVHSAHGSVDVVMNIAGIATWGTVDRLTHEQWRRTVDIDLMGPIHVIECFVPEMMRAGRGGQIVNVSSAAGLVGLPWHAPYSAAKFGLRGVSEVLRFDLRRHRIGVTLVCPGGVDTPITESVEIAGISREAMRNSPFRERFRKRAKSPEHVAERILDGVVRNKYLVHTSADIRLLYLSERLTPHVYEAIMSGANRAFAHQLGKLVENDPAQRAAR